MKKILLGLAAGAMALGAVAMPASAVPPTNSIWDIVDGNPDTGLLEDIILISGYATMLDACGNGKPQYTLFAPVDLLNIIDDGFGPYVGPYEIPVLEAVLDELGYSVADLNSLSAVVRGILNDHLVNGSFSPAQLDTDELTTLTARSGFTLRNELGDTINDQTIVGSVQACNGYVYFLAGFIDSTPQVPTEGLNALDTPQDGTPGGSNTLLPDTL